MGLPVAGRLLWDAMRYAVGFKTHSWDPFIARQLPRYECNVRSGDLCVIADAMGVTLDGLLQDQVLRTPGAFCKPVRAKLHQALGPI